MKHRLGTIEINEKQNVTFNEEITQEQFERVKKCVSEIEHYKVNRNLHTMFIFNFIELSDYFQRSVDRLIKNQIYSLQNDREEFDRIYMHSNRLYLNFLSSFRIMIDHTGTYFSRKYGKDSSEVKGLVKFTNDLYDAHFEYRFFYKLRNYSQHCGLPINSITYEIKNEDGERSAVLNAIFKRDELLAKFDWGKDVKKDLELQPERFPAIWTAGVFYKLVESLYKYVDGIEITNLLPSISYIDELFKDTERDNKDLCVFYDFVMPNPESYENSRFGVMTMPLDLIDEIKVRINEKATQND